MFRKYLVQCSAGTQEVPAGIFDGFFKTVCAATIRNAILVSVTVYRYPFLLYVFSGCLCQLFQHSNFLLRELE